MTRSRQVLLTLVLIYLLGGVLLPHITHSASDKAALGLSLTFPAAIALFAWCKLNAAERHISAPPAAPLLVGLLGVVGVPYYFFKTLPVRSALFAIAKAVVFFVALNVIYFYASRLSARWAV
jgi:hypothetical protein